MATTDLGFLILADATVCQHFGHHEQFSTRHPGREWKFRRVRVPLDELRCLYYDPGVRPDNPVVLMGAIGKPPLGYSGVPILAMARDIEHSLAAGTADLANPGLKKVLEFRDRGRTFIESAPEPLALSCIDGTWFVREGTHRLIALALLGAVAIEAIDFESFVVQ